MPYKAFKFINNNMKFIYRLIILKYTQSGWQ